MLAPNGGNVEVGDRDSSTAEWLCLLDCILIETEEIIINYQYTTHAFDILSRNHRAKYDCNNLKSKETAYSNIYFI